MNLKPLPSSTFDLLIEIKIGRRSGLPSGMIIFYSRNCTSFQNLIQDCSIFRYTNVFRKSEYKYLYCKEFILCFVNGQKITSIAAVRARSILPWYNLSLFIASLPNDWSAFLIVIIASKLW